MKTTYTDKNNSNAEVFRRTNELIKSETAEGEIPKTVKPFVKCYLDSRMKKADTEIQNKSRTPSKTHHIGTRFE